MRTTCSLANSAPNVGKGAVARGRVLPKYFMTPPAAPIARCSPLLVKVPLAAVDLSGRTRRCRRPPWSTVLPLLVKVPLPAVEF